MPWLDTMFPFFCRKVPFMLGKGAIYVLFSIHHPLEIKAHH